MFYLKGVAPKVVQTLDIWKGVVPFIILQLIGLGIVGAYPSLVNYLPNRVYLTSNVAPPPMNPKLQYCLQEYKFANYSNNADVINKSITDFDDIILANLPADKLSYFQRHVDNSKYSFELVNEVKSTETLYNDYAVDYREYRKTVDNAYEDLLLIKSFINDGEKFEELEQEMKLLKNKIDNRGYIDAIEFIDNIFEKVGEISGSDEFADKLDYLITLMDEDEVDFEKLQSSTVDTIALFEQEVSWRKNFKKKYMDRINAHDKVISETIGLRLQSKLTKEQAIYVSKCNSIHRDISLNF